jgi:hypothetical protein
MKWTIGTIAWLVFWCELGCLVTASGQAKFAGDEGLAYNHKGMLESGAP